MGSKSRVRGRICNTHSNSDLGSDGSSSGEPCFLSFNSPHKLFGGQMKYGLL